MDTSTLVGRTIGHHAVLELLGAGGMGVVYKATDTRLDRPVALKVIRPDLMDDSERRRRFVREAKTASALNHPNILTIYEIDSDADIDYIAMEFIGGDTLADVLRSGPLPAERALRLGIQVAEAMAAAHTANIVHRDLKPSNIMLMADDTVKVVDFGLAKLVAGAGPNDETMEAVTGTGAIVGTAPYMSPELIAGRDVDGRSDVFSFGTILYEMLAGRRPFDAGTDGGTLVAILQDTPPPIPGLAPGIQDIVGRCLRKKAEDRFQSATELMVAMNACLAPRSGSERPSVAVLPFVNMSGAKEDDYLCEGLAEEIISVLTGIPGLHVIARTSSFAVSRMELDAREAGARLNVANILEGSVRRAGKRVRVTAQLVDTSTGGHIWSERFDREMTDILALEDDIAGSIADRLRIDLGKAGERPRPRAAVDAEAHSAFLEGRYHLARQTPEAQARAQACLERAIELDPGFARAFDSMAELYWYRGLFGSMPPREAFSQSTWYVLRAIELDETLAETHALLGMLRKELDFNWAEVDRVLRRAFELNRESPLVRLRYAVASLLPHARMDEALIEIDAVLQSDPLSLFVRWWGAAMAYLGHRPERVAEEGRHMIDLDPTHFLGHWAMGISALETDATNEAVPEFEKAHELSGGIPFTLGFLAHAYGRAGRPEAAGKLVAEAEAVAAERYLPPSALGFAYSGLEDWDAAFHWWDRAIEARDPFAMGLKGYPFLDSRRSDPRYRAMLRRMNLDTG